MHTKQLLLFLLLLTGFSAIAQLQPVGSGVFHWADLLAKKENYRETRKIAQGSTNEFEYFEIHASTLQKGAIAKPTHTQKDIEELIIIKEGLMKCTIGNKTAVLGAGSVLLIPPLQAQTFENATDKPLTYYVFMFRSKKKMNIERGTQAGGALLINYDSVAYTEANNKGSKKFFDRPTAMCDRMEMHITYLKTKGPSHAPHTHEETEIILVLEGSTEMMIEGKTYQANAGDLYIASGGDRHGIGNATDKPCSYFAFKWR